MSESFAELFEESLLTLDMKTGTLVTGEVVDIDNDWVTVHAGLKSEAVIPRIQFVNDAGELEIQIGDSVKVSSTVKLKAVSLLTLTTFKASYQVLW